MSADLASQLNATSTSSFANDTERLEVIGAAKALLARLYKPMERIEDVLSSQVPLVAELKTFTDLQAFPKWQRYNGGKPINVDALAGEVGMSVPLMRRFMRHLAIEHVLEEVGPDQYAMSPFAVSFSSAHLSAWADYAYDTFIPTFTALPAFLAHTGYQEPTDPKNGVYQFAKNCPGVGFFEYLLQHPREGATFNTCMTSYASERVVWLQYFPLDHLLTGSDPSGPLFVDVGGGVGHDIEKLFHTVPDLGERLLLQDRPEVIINAICDKSIKRMDHDFFTPQSVKGARAYYLHSVLHDWQAEEAGQILQNLKLAMTPGYSKILINESVVASRNPLPQMVMADIAMMMLSAKERSEADWQELVQSVGLRIEKIWTSPVARESIIEVVLDL